VTYDQLVQELSDRGFAHLSAARRGTYINNARAELDRMYLWPWREKSVTGTSPLAISDLGPIEAVVNTSISSYPLQKVDYRTLLENYGDLSISGTPSYYYVATPSGTPEVATFPSNTNTIGVQYWRVTPDLTTGQSPASPSEAHYVIVDLAARQAYNDNDEFFSASMVQQEVDRKVQQLLLNYPVGQADGPDAFVGVTGASLDW
jgi:hypothetical protein